MSKPTIILVPGSFAPETIYRKTILHLRSLGFPAVALRIPSTTKRMPLAPATMSDDADVIKRSVEAVTATGKEVVVVCHSYGGMPTTQALAGLKGVKRVVYLAAIVPKVGESNVESMGGKKGELPFPMDDGYLHIDATTFAAAVCNDLSWDLAYENTLNFAHHSGASFLEPVTQVGYLDIPVSYIFCEKDLVVNPEKQQGFVDVVQEATGKDVHVVKLDSGHCPNWSMPEKLGDVIAEMAGM
ncbi:Alpha/beta hydrolase fold-1 [Phaeosphaeria sp. MPI-PUGE-AT-0046c]|nr:Alpha/beta hydrolase fold-1 [Phaeosphaeria sp. MPI-PUGE-AT-0046c]